MAESDERGSCLKPRHPGRSQSVDVCFYSNLVSPRLDEIPLFETMRAFHDVFGIDPDANYFVYMHAQPFPGALKDA